MKEKTIEITDKDVIIYLVSRGFKIVHVKKDTQRNRSIIVFRNTKELDQAIIDYANKKGCINIADYIATEKRVRNLFYFNRCA